MQPSSMTMETGGAASRVRVAVRARPLVARERLDGAKACITVHEASGTVTLGTKRSYEFDHAFAPLSSQQKVYDTCVAPLVDSFVAGFNTTVLALGATGSGKTHTLGSGTLLGGLPAQEGITPRLIRHLFSVLQQQQQQAPGRRFVVRMQFLQVLNDEVQDLLSASPGPAAQQQQQQQWVQAGNRDTATAVGNSSNSSSKSAIVIREAADGRIVVTGAREEPASSAEQLLQLLERGVVARATGPTAMNEQSSRSHAILTIILEQSMPSCGQASGSDDAIVSKFHVVDLAGSERLQRVAGVAGVRLKETATINQGLLALGNVISALAEPAPDGGARRRHVPYRASKLTRLLQDSLGGNSNTLLIACVSSADSALPDSCSTLKYAARARAIENRPAVNVAPAAGRPLGGAARSLAAEIQALQLSLLRRLVRQQLLQPAAALPPGLLPELLLTDAAAGALDGPQLLRELQTLAACDAEALLCNEKEKWDQQQPQSASDTKQVDQQQQQQQSASNQPARSPHLTSDGVLRPQPRGGSLEAAALQDFLMQEMAAAQEEQALEAAPLGREAPADGGSAAALGNNQRPLPAAAPTATSSLAAGCVEAASCQAPALPGAPQQQESASAAPDSAGGQLCALSDDEVVVFDEERPALASYEGYAHLSASPFKEDALLLAELQVVLADKAALQEEKAAAQAEAAAAQQAFERSRALMEAQLLQLTAAISTQEGLISTLQANAAEAKQMGETYLARCRQLESELAECNLDLHELTAALARVEADAAASQEEKAALRREYEGRIHAVQAQMISLQKQLRSQDGSRLERERQRAALRAQQLQEELAAMRAQQDGLRQRLQERLVAQERAAAAKAREMAGLRRAAEAARRRVNELEQENRQQRLAIKAHVDQAALAQRQLKELAAAGSSPQAGSARRAGNGTPGRSPRPGSSGSSSTNRTPGGTGGGGTGVLMAACNTGAPAKRLTAGDATSKIPRLPLAAALKAAGMPSAALPAEEEEEQQQHDAVAADVANGCWLQQQLQLLAAKHAADCQLEQLLCRQRDLLQHRAALLASARQEQEAGSDDTDDAASEEEEQQVLQDDLEDLETELELLQQQAEAAAASASAASAAADGFRDRVGGLSRTSLAAVVQQAAQLLVAGDSHFRAAKHRAARLELEVSEQQQQLEAAACSLRQAQLQHQQQLAELQQGHEQQIMQLLRQQQQYEAKRQAAEATATRRPSAGAVVAAAGPEEQQQQLQRGQPVAATLMSPRANDEHSGAAASARGSDGPPLSLRASASKLQAALAMYRNSSSLRASTAPQGQPLLIMVCTRQQQQQQLQSQQQQQQQQQPEQEPEHLLQEYSFGSRCSSDAGSTSGAALPPSHAADAAGRKATEDQGSRTSKSAYLEALKQSIRVCS